MVHGKYELTTGNDVMDWFLDDKGYYLIFTLEAGETWEDKEDDIRETIRRYWKR